MANQGGGDPEEQRPDDYRHARGAVPWREGMPSPEDAIRGTDTPQPAGASGEKWRVERDKQNLPHLMQNGSAWALRPLHDSAYHFLGVPSEFQRLAKYLNALEQKADLLQEQVDALASNDTIHTILTARLRAAEADLMEIRAIAAETTLMMAQLIRRIADRGIGLDVSREMNLLDGLIARAEKVEAAHAARTEAQP